jgi:hypothetical protein
MAVIPFPDDVLAVQSIRPRTVVPAQQNRSRYTGRSKILLLAGAEYMTAQAAFQVLSTPRGVRKAAAFFARLRGMGNTFDLPLTPTPQVKVANPYTNYDLALDFANGAYVVGGERALTLAALGGYSFTRSGQQGAFDASGVDFFAANVPAINSAGFHSYDAVTNNALYSQDVGNAAWTKSGVTVTVNAITAPDGTLTMDGLVENISALDHQAYQFVAGAAKNTASVFVKDNGRRYVQIRCYIAPDDWRTVLFDLVAGTVLGTFGPAVTFTSVTGNIVNLGNGFFRLVVMTERVGAGTFAFAVDLVNSAAPVHTVFGSVEYAGDVTKGLYLWQMQSLGGFFPDGGPVIVTAGATASIGASTLLNTIPALVDEDLVIGSKIKFNGEVNWGAILLIDDLTANNVIRLGRSANNAFFFIQVVVAGVPQDIGTNPVGAISQFDADITVLLRRKAGKWSFHAKHNGVTYIGIEGAAGAMPANLTRVLHGIENSQSVRVNGAVKGSFIRRGTFSDGDIAAILENPLIDAGGIPAVPALAFATKTAGGAAGARSMTLSTTDGLEEGMYGAVALPSGHRRAFIVTEVLGAVINFEPSLPEAVANGATVDFVRPALRCRLDAPEHDYDYTEGLGSFACSVEEAL